MSSQNSDTNLAVVVKKLQDAERAKIMTRLQHMKKLKDVPVNADDITKLMEGFGITKNVADRLLKECGGDFKKTVDKLINGWDIDLV